MRKVRMLATWQDTGNTRGDIAGFDAKTAAHLVARGLAAYVDDDDKPKAKPEAKPKAEPAPAVDKMVESDSTINKITKKAARRRRRADPIGENEGD